MSALPFITIEDNDRFNVNPEAIEYLRSLEGRVAVVSVAGQYRTGKSLLLNLLSGGAGFQVGPTVKACTKGIWLYGKTISSPSSSTLSSSSSSSPLHVLFLDTEGLGSTIRSETYDARVFALTLLLSSFFVYNSVGTIDGNAISKLSLVVSLTRHVHVKAQQGGKEDTGTEFSQFFPSFMWVVRDFAVKLEKDGRKISSREYLEDALRPEEGMTEAIESKNAVRMLLRNFFPERDCLCMVRPVADEKALMALGSGAGGDDKMKELESSLRPEFKSQVEALRKKVVAGARPKTLFGKPLSGAMLASLAGAYVQALNSNSTPTISTAWDRVVDSQCADALEGGLIVYMNKMKELLQTYSSRAEAEAKAFANKSGQGTSSSLSSSSSSSSSSLLSTLHSLAPHSFSPPAVTSLIVEEDELLIANAEASQEAIRFFQARSIQDNEKTLDYETTLRGKLFSEFQKMRKDMDASSATFCTSLINTLHNTIFNAKLQALLTSSSSSSSAEDIQFDAEFDNEDNDVIGTTKGKTPSPSSSSSSPSASNALKVKNIAEAVISPSLLASFYRSALSSIRDAYAREARGSAKHRIVAEYGLVGLAPTSALAEAAASADSSATTYNNVLSSKIAALERATLNARAKARSASVLLKQEQSSSNSALVEATRMAAAEREAVHFKLAARESELDRTTSKMDRLIAAFEASSVRSDAREADLAVALAGSRARVDELLTTRVDMLLEEGVAAQRLAESEKKRADLEKALGESKLRAESSEKGVAVIVERVKAAENETVRLREQTELLYESNRVAKDVIERMRDEKEELEYQLATTKGKLAEAEGNRASLQSDLAGLESLASRLKTVLVKDKALKKLALDRLEQRKFDALPVVDDR